MRKRWLMAGILLMVIFSLVSSLVIASADMISEFTSGFEEGIEGVEEILTPVFEALLDTQSGEFFFAKVMLLLLLFIIIFTVIKEIPALGENRAVVFIIAAVVSIFAVRYLPDDTFFTAILLPYTTVGTAIAVFLPYLIYLFFVHQSIPGTYARRAAWVVFGIVFLILWALRGVGQGAGQWLNLAGAGLVVFSFVFDKSIHGAFEQWGLSRAMAGIEDEAKSIALQKYREAVERYNIDSTPFNKRNLKNAKRRLRNLGVRIPSY